MAVEDMIALLGHAVDAHVDGEVLGFIKGDKEGLLVVHEGVQYVLTLQTREVFDAHHTPGLTLYELGDDDHKDVGGES